MYQVNVSEMPTDTVPWRSLYDHNMEAYLASIDI